MSDDDVEDVFDLGNDVEADENVTTTEADRDTESTADEAPTGDQANSGDTGEGATTDEQPASKQRETSRTSPRKSRRERAADVGRAVTSEDAQGTTRYALPQTWTGIKQLENKVENKLLARGINDASGNEISDAMMVVVQNYADEVADQVIERRLQEQS